jgi:anti-sigma B factor antagonist
MASDVRETAGGLRITRRDAAGVTLLRLEGELDLATAPELSTAVQQAFEGVGQPVVLDMAAVGFIDSTGVRTLLEAQHLAGRDLVLMAPSGAVTRVLDLTRLRGRFVEIDADADLATVRH